MMCAEKFLVKTLSLALLLVGGLVADSSTHGLDVDVVQGEGRPDLEFDFATKSQVAAQQGANDSSSSSRPYRLGIVSRYVDQDLASKRDGSKVEEASFNVGLDGTYDVQWDQHALTFGLELSYQKGDFKYRSGEAELSIDGYKTAFRLDYRHPDLPKLQVSSGIGYAKVEGRDYVDRVLGRTGLTVDAELTSWQMFIIPSYEILKLTSSTDQHSFRLRAGWLEQDWKMSMGWVTNAEEKLEKDHPWILGVEHLWHKTKVEKHAFQLKTQADIMDGGYQLGLGLSRAF